MLVSQWIIQEETSRIMYNQKQVKAERPAQREVCSSRNLRVKGVDTQVAVIRVILKGQSLWKE